MKNSGKNDLKKFINTLPSMNDDRIDALVDDLARLDLKPLSKRILSAPTYQEDINLHELLDPSENLRHADCY